MYTSIQTWLCRVGGRFFTGLTGALSLPSLALVTGLCLVGCGSDKPKPQPSSGGSTGTGGASAGHGGTSGGSAGKATGGAGGTTGTSGGDAGAVNAGASGDENAGQGEGAAAGEGGTTTGAGGSSAHSGGTGGDMGMAGEAGGGAGGERSGAGGHSAGGASNGGKSGASGSAGQGTGGGAGAGGSTGLGGSAGVGGLGGLGGAGAGGAGSGGIGGSSGSSGVVLTMTANPDPVVANGAIAYEIKVTNTQSTALTNVVLTEQTQNNAVTYLSGTTGGATCGGSTQCGAGVIVTWPTMTLGAGQTQTLWMLSGVTGATTTGTNVHNTATVTYPGHTLTQSLDVAVDNPKNLQLGMTGDRDLVAPGDELVYTLTLGNTGTQALPLSTSGVLSVAVPAGATFVSATGGGTSENGKVQWNVGSVNPGATEHYTFTVSVGGSLPNGTVLVPSANLDDNGTSVVRATTQTEVRAGVPIKLAVSVDNDPVAANGALFYEFKVSNTSGSTLTNVVLTDQVDNALTYINLTTGGAACGGSTTCGGSTIVTWPAFTLAAGQTQTVWMIAGVPSSTPSGTLVRSHTAVAYSGGTVATTYDATVDSTQKLRLGISEDHNPVHAGDQLTYTVTLGNTASQALPLSSAGVLEATLPPGTTFVSATGGGTSANGAVSWNVGSVNPGATQHYSYTVSVGSSLPDGTVLEPFAQMLDGATSLVRATAETEVRATVPLKLVMSLNPDPAAANGGLYYEFKFTNTSSSTLTNVVLTDQLDNALTYINLTTGGAACGGSTTCGGSTIVTWPAFTLAAGQTQTLWMVAGVPSATPSGTLVRNRAVLSSASGTVVETFDATVDSAQNLHLGMVEDHDPVHAGDQLVYTLTLGNTGTQALPLSSSGTLTATLPARTTFVSATSGGSSANGVVSWNVGSVNPGAVQRYTYTVSVGSVADGTLLAPVAQLFDGATNLVRAGTQAEVRAVVPLTLQVSAAPDPVAPNALVTYTYAITNTSASTLTNVVLTEHTHNAATGVLADSSGSPACGGSTLCGAGVLVTWPAFTLTSGQQTTVQLTSSVTSGTVNGTIIDSDAMLTYTGGSLVRGTEVAVHN